MDRICCVKRSVGIIGGNYVEICKNTFYNINERVARFCACVSQVLIKMVGRFAYHTISA